MRTCFNRSELLSYMQSTRTFVMLCVVISLLCRYPTLADVSVRTPGSSSTIPVGTPVVIQWTNDLEADRVDVELWDGMRRSTTVIASDVPAHQREIAWTIPNAIEEGSRYRIVIRDALRRSRTIHSVGFLAVRKRNLMPSSVDVTNSDPTEMDVAPMPATEKIRLTWVEPMKHIEIVDPQGVVLRHIELTEGAAGCVLNVTDLGSGSYSVVGHTQNGRLVRRPLIVQR